MPASDAPRRSGSLSVASPEQQRLVRIAARAVGRAGLAHAYGHCSLRLDDDAFLVCAARPLGLIGVGEPGTVVPVRGALPDGVLGEVRIHQRIYAARADARGIVRFQSPQLMALTTLGRMPAARHGFGAYFHPSAPLWPDPRLLRDDASAQALAERLAGGRAIGMRGNGAVTVGASLPEAVTWAWYLEDAARVELLVLASGAAGLSLDADEAADRATLSGRIVERMWEYLTAGDPEGGAEAAA